MKKLISMVLIMMILCSLFTGSALAENAQGQTATDAQTATMSVTGGTINPDGTISPAAQEEPQVMDEEATAENIPEDTKREILNAGAQVLLEGMDTEARAMGIYDVHSTKKHAVDTIMLKKAKLTDDGGSVEITYRGKRRDKHHKTPTRNAEIMFINNYGKKGQSARPFINVAFRKKEEKAVEEAQAAFDKWQNSNFGGG